MGNMCRSPVAQTVALKLAQDAGLSQHLKIESAGTQAHHAFAEGLHETDVTDPYFGNAAGFGHVLDLCEAGARGLIRSLRELSHWHIAKPPPAATPVPLKRQSGPAAE